jgi:hypothetical protein
MKNLDFNYPFSGMTDLDFINCFAGTYMYLEGIKGVDDYVCAARDGGKCNGCGNCNVTTWKKQEDLFFFFGTMSGCNAQRCSYDGQNDIQKMCDNIDSTDVVIEFSMGLAGYGYTKITGDFKEAITGSVDVGIPVLARMKDTSHGSFRVITGYDNDDIICPDPGSANRKPDSNPTYDEIENIYVITGRSEPKYGLRDGLLRIISVMECNRDMKLWDEYISKFKYWDQLKDSCFDEVKHRFKRVCDTMWHTFNCHNFAETFRHKIWDGMKDERYAAAFNKIDAAYDNTHTRGWQIIALNDCRDWSTRRYNELEWGMCECVINCLEAVKKNDADVLAAIKEAIEIYAGNI